MSAGLSNPRRSVMICVAAIAAGGAMLLIGILMGGDQGPAPVLIAVGLLVVIVFPLFLLNFLWAVRVTERMKRGDGVIARWTVPLHTLEEFREDDSSPKKMRRKNDYRLPRKLPQEGLEVIFSADAVMIGDTFFGLAKSGIARFTDVSTVPGNPLSIAFRMAFTNVRGTSYGAASVHTSRSELRVPVARTANDEASKVLAHYTAVQQGRIQVKPKFWTLRIKIGLWAAAIGVVAAVAGFALNAMKVKAGDVPLILAVSGVMGALGGVVLAGIAWALRNAERADKTR